MYNFGRSVLASDKLSSFCTKCERLIWLHTCSCRERKSLSGNTQNILIKLYKNMHTCIHDDDEEEEEEEEED